MVTTRLQVVTHRPAELGIREAQIEHSAHALNMLFHPTGQMTAELRPLGITGYLCMLHTTVSEACNVSMVLHDKTPQQLNGERG